MKTSQTMNRRRFITLSTGAVIGVSLPGIFARAGADRATEMASALRLDGRSRIPPGQELVEMIEDMGGTPGPALNDNWRLTIHGEVERELSLTWQTLMQLPQADLNCDIHCVTGWTLLDSHWRGIRLSDLMAAVHVTASAKFVIFEAYAGYSSNIDIAEARKENVLLAHEFAGTALPQTHGAPLRALVPDRYFYKSAKWLTGINFSAVDIPGFWESGAYSNTADPWKEERFDEVPSRPFF